VNLLESTGIRGYWLVLFNRVNEVDPLTCPKCQGKMTIISFIENEEVIEKILKHLGLWDLKSKPPPRANAPPVHVHLDYSDSQVPPREDHLNTDPNYPSQAYTS
jgi:hypothetical protein